jgi:hypothetical protein
LESHDVGLEALQPVQIPQNGQRNFWKSLDKNSLDLERLGKKIGDGRRSLAAAQAVDRQLTSVAASAGTAPAARRGGGSAIKLGGLLGAHYSYAVSINDTVYMH